MRSRVLAVLVPALLLSLPAAAFTRGDVVAKFQTVDPSLNLTSFEVWQYEAGWPYAAGVAEISEQSVGWYVSHFLVPSPSLMLFDRGGTMQGWDGASFAAS